MPFEIVRNDIVNMQVDAVVNTANPKPVVGTGVDTAIHQAAGPELLKAREEVGALAVGTAAVTPGFDLPAKYVVHVAGPAWGDGSHGEEELLAESYRAALEAADAKGCESIAFPLLSTGNYGFPKQVSLQVALREFGAFLMEHEMTVYLTVFGDEAYRLSRMMFPSVESYIDAHYVEERLEEEYEGPLFGSVIDEEPRLRRLEAAREQTYHAFDNAMGVETIESAKPAAKPVPSAAKPSDLEQRIRNMDATFSDTLMALIADTGKKPSEIYRKANISKQHFSKINSNSHYQPTKPTVIAFAMALELSLAETRALLDKAGFSLSHSILFDVIVESFLVDGDYDIFELDFVLKAYDQPLVGGKEADA